MAKLGLDALKVGDTVTKTDLFGPLEIARIWQRLSPGTDQERIRLEDGGEYFPSGTRCDPPGPGIRPTEPGDAEAAEVRALAFRLATMVEGGWRRIGLARLQAIHAILRSAASK